MSWIQALIAAGWTVANECESSGTFLVITPEGEELSGLECDDESEAWQVAWEEHCFREFWHRFNQRAESGVVC